MAIKTNRWEVWWARVPFDDSIGEKERPILILEDKKAFVLSMKMTSHPPRSGEYLLKEWDKAGLSVPTTVRTGLRISLEKTRLIRKLGTLTNNDIVILKTFYMC